MQWDFNNNVNQASRIQIKPALLRRARYLALLQEDLAKLICSTPRSRARLPGPGQAVAGATVGPGPSGATAVLQVRLLFVRVQSCVRASQCV